MPLVHPDRSPFDWREYECLSPKELLREGVLPPVSGLYSHDAPSVAALLVSHAHQDHYGFLRFVHPEIPVYCSAGTRALIEVSNVFLNTEVDLRPVRQLAMWKPAVLDGFRVTPYLMDHSAPDAAAFLVEADDQKLFYSGDFRGHGRKKILLERLVRSPVRDVDCLLMEGTMLGRTEGAYRNEDEVEEAIRDLILSSCSYTFVFASSQNLDRLVSVYRAAKRSGALFVIDLYTAFVLDRLKVISSNIPQSHWKDVRVLYPHGHATKLAAFDQRQLYRFTKNKTRLPDLRAHAGRVVFFCRDNNYFRVMLQHLGNVEDARAVYSMWPGYLERSDLEDLLTSRGIGLEMIHTSGHAVEDDLKRLVEALDPACVVPMHTFHPERFKKIFENAVLLEDGEELELPCRKPKEGAPMRKKVIQRYLSAALLDRVIHDFRFLTDITGDSDGELNLQLRENYLSLYYKGNSLARIGRSSGNRYRIDIHHRFLEDRVCQSMREHSVGEPSRGREGTSAYVRFYVEPRHLHPFLKKQHLLALAQNITKVNYGEEIAFEQVLMTDNQPTDTFIIIDRQVGDHSYTRQMDLLALSRDSTDEPFHFVVIEVKLGKNPELQHKVGQQLSDYVAHVREHIRDYVDCYRENYRQKKIMGLFDEEMPDEVEIEDRVEGVVVTGGYSLLAEKAKKELESQFDISVQVMKNVIGAV